MSAEPTVDSRALEHEAAAARAAGDFDRAAELFAEAARGDLPVHRRLNLDMRRVHCLASGDRGAEALPIAERVVEQARAERLHAELADALAVLVEHHFGAGRFAVATDLLGEATFALDHLPDEPASYQVVHNLAVTYARCGFFAPAIEAYERSLRLAADPADRLFSYANMAAAYHGLALASTDPEARSRALHDGLYAATAALDPTLTPELLCRGVAYAHRAMMLAAIGHDAAALADAQAARDIAAEHAMRGELALAMAAEVVAGWRLRRDPGVLELIAAVYVAAHGTDVEPFLRSVREVEVEVLGTVGRIDEARAVLNRVADDLLMRVERETAARWEHVRLAAQHRRVEAISESDPLTGLPNRRFLGRTLPEVLDTDPPVCVGVIDLDGFKRVNDEYGYLLGDQVLQQLAAVLERLCRRGDAVVRLGGDEFVMVVREASPNDARVVFERVRKMIAECRWSDLPPSVRLTASVGVAVGSGGQDASRVLADAMDALRHAKRAGRDRISFR